MTPNHEQTHAPIAELLAAAAAKGLDVDGVTWLSRQTGGPTQHPVALALFQPPCPPAELFAPDPTIAPVDLDSSLGELLIDAVLRRAELVRADDPADEGNTEDPDTA